MDEIKSISDIIDDNFIESNFNDSLYVYIGDIKSFPITHYNGIALDRDNIMCLKYNKGVGFEKHSHVKIDDSHIYDLIIFPPISLLPEKFKGGDLIIYHDDHIERIRVDNLEKWLVVRLDLEVPHEVEAVEYGIRYSFKYEIYSD